MPRIKLAALLSAPIFLAGCLSTSDPMGSDPSAWSNYREWYKVNPEPNTGDPTGFLGGVHEGNNAYRDIYVNAVGEPANRGQTDFPYPPGSILLKETYSDLKDYEARAAPELTIMIKLRNGISPQTGDWEYVLGADGSQRGTGDSGLATFCHGCHQIAASTDYNFINSRFLSESR